MRLMDWIESHWTNGLGCAVHCKFAFGTDAHKGDCASVHKYVDKKIIGEKGSVES